MQAQIAILMLALAVICSNTFAQTSTQSFWKQRNVIHINTDEKMNQPLQPILEKLLSAYISGKIRGYQPDNPGEVLPVSLFLSRQQDIEYARPVCNCPDGIQPDQVFEFNPYASLSAPSNEQLQMVKSLLYQYGTEFEVVEDRQFKKQSSTLVPDPIYIRMVRIDPAEVLPDQIGVVFKYTEVRSLLESIPYQLTQNDVQSLDTDDALRMKMYSGYLIDISGKKIRDLNQSETFRNNQTNMEDQYYGK